MHGGITVGIWKRTKAVDIVMPTNAPTKRNDVTNEAREVEPMTTLWTKPGLGMERENSLDKNCARYCVFVGRVAAFDLSTCKFVSFSLAQQFRLHTSPYPHTCSQNNHIRRASEQQLQYKRFVIGKRLCFSRIRLCHAILLSSCSYSFSPSQLVILL